MLKIINVQLHVTRSNLNVKWKAKKGNAVDSAQIKGICGRHTLESLLID